MPDGRQVAGQGEFGDYVRGNELGFRLLGVRKIDALLSILGSGLHIVLSDVACRRSNPLLALNSENPNPGP